MAAAELSRYVRANKKSKGNGGKTVSRRGKTGAISLSHVSARSEPRFG